MKKLLPILVLLLVVAGVIVFTQRRAGGVGARFPASRAAELAPAETVAFLHLPDLDRTRARWERDKVGAGALQREKILSSTSLLLGNIPEFAQLFRDLLATEKLEPAGMFFAATSLRNRTSPNMVGGFPVRGKRTDVEATVRAMKAQLFGYWPGAGSELSSHRGIEIETITGQSALRQKTAGNARPGAEVPSASELASLYPVMSQVAATQISASATGRKGVQLTLHLAFRDDWVFFATDRALLAGVLDRYLRNEDATASLAHNGVFLECQAHETPEADLVRWAVWDPFVLQDWLPLPIAVWDDEPNAGQAAHYTLRAGAPMSDVVYLHLTRPPQTRAAASTAAPEPRGFSSVNLDAFQSAKAAVIDALSLDPKWTTLGRWSQLGILLQHRKFTVDDLWVAFGPAVSFVESEQTYASSPEFLVAVEVRDGAKARAFAEALVADGKEPLRVTTDGEATRWDWETRRGAYVQPPLVLTKTHLLFGASHRKLLEGRGPGYFPDPIALLKRDPAGGADGLGQLPLRSKRSLPWAAIQKHLRPSTVRVRPAGPGWVLEQDDSLVDADPRSP